MAKNEQLTKIVGEKLGEVLMELDPKFKEVCRGDVESAGEIVGAHGIIDVGTAWKSRVRVGPLIGYGYDFSQTDEEQGRSAKDTYEYALGRTREMTALGSAHIEQLVGEGIVDDVFGWYVTRLPL
jgi:hypothetical protein